MMKGLSVLMLAAGLTLSLAMGGCGQAASGPSPAQATLAPAKPTEPAKSTGPAKAAAPAPTSQPTAAPAKKVDFPQKGKAITLIIPYAAGGSADLNARILAPALEKELGVPVQVVDKPGAGTQTGVTELAKSKPDGYTLGNIALPSTLLTYLDPERKAEYSRKDFAPVSMFFVDTFMVGVLADSSYKTIEDFKAAAKAKPGQLKSGTGGLMTASHMTSLMVAKALGVELTYVHFDGTAPAVTALLGGHIDDAIITAGGFQAQFNSGTVRILGIADKEEMKSFPGVKTLAALGYPVDGAISYAFAAPAGTPREVVEILDAAFKKVLADPEIKKKMEDTGVVPRYMGADDLAKYWADMEPTLKPLIDLAKKQ